LPPSAGDDEPLGCPSLIISCACSNTVPSNHQL